MMKKFLAVGIICLGAASAFAGGSASREDILGLVPQDVARYAVKAYAIDSVGICVRTREGARILPCSIEATSRENGARVGLTFEASGFVTEQVL
ncbi:MAG TPA: hypothetical protein PL182_05995 [Pseudobdellovibrionaceae bacterium]|nr:hypothetical protein [Pseudobdellovibrionaceae bacterium]